MSSTTRKWRIGRMRAAVAARDLVRVGTLLVALTAGRTLGQGFPALATGQRPPVASDSVQAERPLAEIAGAAVTGPSQAADLSQFPAVRARYEAAQARLATREYERAASELDAALELDGGTCYEVLYLLARADFALGRAGRAHLAAEHALVLRPDAADVHLLLGRWHRSQQRPAPAIAHLRSATLAAGPESANPNVTLAWYELGELLAEQGYLAAAAEAYARFDQAVGEEHPEQRRQEEVAALLAQHPHGVLEARLALLRRLGRTTELVAAAERAFRARPRELYLERLYVRALLDAGQAAAALDHCRHELDSAAASPAREAALLTLAIEAGQASGHLADWVAEMAHTRATAPQAEPGKRLARRLDEAKEYDLSIRLWRAQAEAQPDSVDAAWSLASALREAGDLPAALDSLITFVRRNAGSGEPSHAAAEIPPERLAAWMRTFASTGEFLRLVSAFTERPDCDFATYTVLATTAAAAAQAELAERLFRDALEARPGFPLAHLGWGRMSLAAYRWDEAISHAQEALKSVPDSCAAHFLLAEAHIGLDEHDAAEDAYKAAAERCPEQGAYLLALGRYYRRTGNPLAAQRYFQQAWNLDHANADAVEELVDSYLEAGKVEVARDAIQEAESSDVPEDALRRMRTALRFVAAPMQAEHLAELTRQFEQHPDDVTTALKLGAGLYVTQHPDEALRVAEHAQALAPNDERAITLLARVRLRRLEAGSAAQTMEDMVRRYPRRRSALRLLADAYLADFQIPQARTALQRLLALDLGPQQREQIRETLAGTYLELGEFEGSLALTADWIAEDPHEPAWHRARMRTLLAAERYEEALALARDRLKPVTERFEELRDKFEQLAEQRREEGGAGAEAAPGDPELAARLAAAERELNPLAAELYDRRSDFVQVCLDGHAYNVGEEQVRAWLADGPNPPQVQEWLIELLLAAKRGAAALDEIAKLAPKTPSDVVKVVIWRAQALALADRREDALSDLNKLVNEGFLETAPAARAQAQQEILTMLLDKAEFERADKLCDRWLAEVATDDRVARFGALTLKRFVLQAAGRDADSVAVMQELLAVQPYDPGLNNDLGYTWTDLGENSQRALEMIKLAVAAEPLNAAFLDSLGWAYYKLGDFDRAREYLARSVRLRTGRDATVFDHLGDAEYRLGDRGAARQRWEKALDISASTTRTRPDPRDVELIANLRKKLAALDHHEAPAVAATAAEAQRAPR